MKFIPVFLLFFVASGAFAQETPKPFGEPDPAKKNLQVKTACGQCMLGMAGKGCTLAVRIKNKTYFVENTGIDDHGDPHADDGFCNKVRKAEVQGEIKDNRFWATYFRLTDGGNEKKN
jgi:hypothetical protein